MKVELHEITIRQLAEGYADNDNEGVVGYGGRLNIRPKYQREFVYKDKQRNAVIDTVVKYFPLNVMYWAVCDDGTYEVIDGQQRTISICQYVTNVFSFGMRYFHNLQSDEQERILNYPLTVYICSGTDSEKLEWFRTINIAGENLRSRSCAMPFMRESGCRTQSVISARTTVRHKVWLAIISKAQPTVRSISKPR